MTRVEFRSYLYYGTMWDYFAMWDYVIVVLIQNIN